MENKKVEKKTRSWELLIRTDDFPATMDKDVNSLFRYPFGTDIKSLAI